MARYRIVNKILDSEDTYMKKLNQLVEVSDILLNVNRERHW